MLGFSAALARVMTGRVHARACVRAEACVAIRSAYENKTELAPLAQKIEWYRKPAPFAFRVVVSSQLRSADIPILSRL